MQGDFNMVVLIFRLLILMLTIFLIYRLFKYVVNPKRKLELAHEKKQFYLYDNPNNVRKNFSLTYKGILFEGEKYLGTTDYSFEVVSIFIWVKSTSKLKGMEISDFMFIEEKLMEYYPEAQIDWKSPIKEFLAKH
jgi:hypothetical protein